METIAGLINILMTIYVSLPILALVILLIYYLSGKALSRENLDKLLEFGKWYMVAVAIVFAAKVIDSSISDRETSIKEIAIYDKYATNILEADNIEKRWKLSEYFAAVTPSKLLRDRWDAYKVILKPEYDQFIVLRQRDSVLSAKTTLNDKEQAELLSIQQKQSSLNMKLSTDEENQYIIVFTADTNIDQAQYENKNLISAGIVEPIIVNKGKLFFNISKSYNTRNEAAAELATVQKKVRQDVYITSSSKFCGNKMKKDSYYICQ